MQKHSIGNNEKDLKMLESNIKLYKETSTRRFQKTLQELIKIKKHLKIVNND
jgi:hypothetical protein